MAERTLAQLALSGGHGDTRLSLLRSSFSLYYATISAFRAVISKGINVF